MHCVFHYPMGEKKGNWPSLNALDQHNVHTPKPPDPPNHSLNLTLHNRRATLLHTQTGANPVKTPLELISFHVKIGRRGSVHCHSDS